MNYKVELKHFIWHKDQRLLTTELSSLPDINNHMAARPPNYVTIHNPKTKNSREFRYVSTETDSEGDVVSWKYENISHSLLLKIWND